MAPGKTNCQNLLILVPHILNLSLNEKFCRLKYSLAGIRLKWWCPGRCLCFTAQPGSSSSRLCHPFIKGTGLLRYPALVSQVGLHTLSTGNLWES